VISEMLMPLEYHKLEDVTMQVKDLGCNENVLSMAKVIQLIKYEKSTFCGLKFPNLSQSSRSQGKKKTQAEYKSSNYYCLIDLLFTVLCFA
jgi:hypothetical protein